MSDADLSTRLGAGGVTAWLRLTELDRLSAAELADRISQAEAAGIDSTPRRYPGYPTWRLPRHQSRWRPAIDTVMGRRRCRQPLGTRFPTARVLGSLLATAHGVVDESYRGPTPSAGCLQALELYLVHWQAAWLPPGVFHYDRRGHWLARVVADADSARWRQRVPSMWNIEGGALLWLVVGDVRRVTAKYGPRAERFLLLEAGHLMQNLCLVSTSRGMCTIPLGGCLEQDIAAELQLPAGDSVLYTGVCG